MISFFIPIRKNSKRVKNKNTRKIKTYKLGLTEIKILQLKKFLKENSYSIRNMKYEFIISTDCSKICLFLKKYKWIKIHNRSKKLSDDDCLDDLIKEVPKICNGKFILWTHVTSPLFDEKCYGKFISQFIQNTRKYDSAFSANVAGTFAMNHKKKWISHNPLVKKWPRTQDLKNLYLVNNAAFIAKRSVYISNKDRLGDRILPLVSKNLTGFDIDNLDDFNFFKNKLI
jgi:CMP-N-acetylneuraminic acid synthetase